MIDKSFNAPVRSRSIARLSLLAAVAPVLVGLRPAAAEDVSAPVILQWFDGSYKSIETRMADVFAAGYGAVWTPPPGRADSGNQSVGYDAFDRFDLGSAGNPTLYGTETGIKKLSSTLHSAGLDFHVDYVINHNGFRDRSNSGFKAAGGYPGFWLGEDNLDGPDHASYSGDFHHPFAGGDKDGRLAGLIDINHNKDNRFVRNPVPGFNNIPAGSFYNIPNDANRRFYPSTAAPVKYLNDPTLNQFNIPVYDFDLAEPMNGDPVEENAMGYLMRNAQWLVQVVGVDGLRIDAGKHVEGFALDYFDRAVYRANNRKLLDGSIKHVFSYSEVFDGDPNYLLTHVKKTIDPSKPNDVGGNRDTLDFKLYFALKGNLDSYGTNGAWYNVKDASLDFANDGIRDGDAGVAFVGNHDTPAPDKLNNVAHAYVLMMPGNATVYFNAKEFGDHRDFPKDGRGDALSVGNAANSQSTSEGSQISRLVGIRNTHGRGNYKERWVDNEGLFLFERESSAVVGLSNRGDGGFDTRTIEVGFAPGTILKELTGNAADGSVDPFNDIKETVKVVQGGDGKSYATVRVPRNFNANGAEHGRGYVVYGLATPESTNGLQLSNVSQTLAGDSTPDNNYQNGTQRQSSVAVLTGNTTRLRLQTNAVSLYDPIEEKLVRDTYADGDFAAFKIDGGLDFNGNGVVDNRTPNSVAYGFESFTTKNSPLIGNGGLGAPRGDGEFFQDINISSLSEGYHFIEARAFRHRTDNGPAVFSEWKQTVYVDRFKPVSSINSFNAFSGASAGETDAWFKSDDMTANGMHILLNLPAGLTDQQIMARVNAGEGRATQIDRDMYKLYFGGGSPDANHKFIPNGNNVFTIVSFEITGNSNIQRFVGQRPANMKGFGFGDTNFDGILAAGDIAGTNYGFEKFLYARNNEFNPAADLNADGFVDTRDMFALEPALKISASSVVQTEMRQVVLRRGNMNADGVTNGADIDALFDRLGKTGDNWLEDLNTDGAVTNLDVDTLVRQVFNTEFGDANLDTRVDFADFVVLRDHFGQSGGWALADFNGDNAINRDDYLLLRTYFGFNATVTPEEVAQVEAFVPEPACLGLAALAIPMLRRRRLV